MKTNAMTETLQNEILDAVRAAKDEYGWDCVGVRWQEQPFQVGPIDHVSSIWDDGEVTDEELDGICVLDATDERTIIKHGADYQPIMPHVAILVGDKHYRDDLQGDPGEALLQNAEVVAVIR